MNELLDARKVAIQRLETLMTRKQKDGDGNVEAVTCDESSASASDESLFSQHTYRNYRQTTLHFIDWCNERQKIDDHSQIDAQSNTLVSRYLTERMQAGYSAWTLKGERSILRFYFQNKELAQDVDLPPRHRANIIRSRRPTKRSERLNPDKWQHVIQFCLATGASLAELRSLRVCDIYIRSTDEQLIVRLTRNKGKTWREVEIFPGREQAVLSLIEGLEQAPEIRIFLRISSLLPIQGYRRQFAQELYVYLSGRPLPPHEGRLHTADIDRKAAQEVSRRLGLRRIDALYTHYLR